MNKIADYTNSLATGIFGEYNSRSAVLAQEGLSAGKILGVSITVDIVHAGPFSVSAKITTIGDMGEGDFTKVKAYIFDYNGAIKNEIPRGIFQSYYESALESFKNTDVYANYKDSLKAGWETRMRSEILELGNWYLNDKGVVFIVSPSTLGIEADYKSSILIQIETEQL